MRSNAAEKMHLFHVFSLSIKPADEVAGIYKTMKNAGSYVVVNFDHNFELNSASLNASLLPYEGNSTRYDPQFVTLNVIK